MKNKVYNLSFGKILDEINNYQLGTIIESQSGDRYVLSTIDTSNKKRKFSRIKSEGTSLRFMTYNNSKRMFRIVEENNEEIDIDSIEELNDSCYDTEIMTNEEKGYYHNLTREKLNKLLKAVKQINNKLKEK